MEPLKMRQLGRKVAPLATFALLLSALAAVGSSGGPSSQETDLEFVERVLGYMNNNEECTLPTIKQVNEIHRIFEGMRSKAGDDFEVSLSDDQKLFKRTVLKEWESFSETVSKPVMILSARKSMFISRIEFYQQEKFGQSVCSRLKRTPGPITDRIFEKNPIVRYLKHLETGEVVNPPSKAELEAQARKKAELIARAKAEEEAKLKAEAEAKAKAEAEARAKAEAEARAKAEAEARARAEAEAKARAEAEEEARLKAKIEATAEAEAKAKAEAEARAKAEAEARAKAEAQARARAEAEEEARLKAEERARAEEEAEKLKLETEAKEERERAEADFQQRAKDEVVDEGNEEEETVMKDVQHNFIGEFVVELDEIPKSFTITIEHDDQDNERDPLTEIPVPRFYEEAEAEEAPNGQRDKPMNAVDRIKYFDADQDDEDLDKLVYVPGREMHYDPIYGYFQWPDECQGAASGGRTACNADVELDEKSLGLGGVWEQFLNDPYGYDKEQQRARTKNAVRTGAERGRLVEERRESIRSEYLFAHDIINRPPPIVWPTGVNPDRWRYIANNNYCKIGFNQGRIVHSTKSGYRTVKSFTRAALVSSRRRLLSGVN